MSDIICLLRNLIAKQRSQTWFLQNQTKIANNTLTLCQNKNQINKK